MAELHEIAEQAISYRLPLLLIDTCSALDLIRCPTRMNEANIAAALSIIDAAVAHPCQCYVVRSSLIEKEFHDNIESAKSELTRELTALTEKIARLDAAANYFNINLMNAKPASELSNAIEQLAISVIANSNYIDRYADARDRAEQRVIESRPPAQKAKQSFKDCVIFEEYLELARRVAASNSNQPIAFLTSNKSDYGLNENIHPDIESDAKATGMQVCLSWHHAYHVLFGPPTR